MTKKVERSWEKRKYFVGFDWGKNTHAIVTFDPTGKIVLDMEIKHDINGWNRLRKKLHELAGPDLSVVAVVIETTCGPAVEKLLELGCTVYPINPKAAKGYRERKSPCGAKSDHLDALSFGDALRTDGHGWRVLMPDDPIVQELRLLCRDEVSLIGQRTLFVNQLREALHEYYPAVLEGFDDWTKESSWAFVVQFSTPQSLKKAGKRKWMSFKPLNLVVYLYHIALMTQAILLQL